MKCFVVFALVVLAAVSMVTSQPGVDRTLNPETGNVYPTLAPVSGGVERYRRGALLSRSDGGPYNGYSGGYNTHRTYYNAPYAYRSYPYYGYGSYY